jgi:LysM repeat protein
MRRLRFLLFILISLAAPLTAHADGPSHIVAYGETLYSIARAYGVTPQALANANGLTTQSWVYAGQRLIIPGSSASQNAPASVARASPSGMYIVRAGDTLYSVSRQFGVSVNAIADANDIPPNGFLYTGTQLKIPGASAAAKILPPPAKNPNSAPAASQNDAAPNNASQNDNAPAPNSNASVNATALSYIVQPGDTLFGIAVKHGVTIQAIVIVNNLSTQFVYSGQRLTIPGAVSNSTQANNAPAAPASNASVSTGINLRVADVPAYRQEQTLTCEESAAAMATFGALSENQIVAAMPRSDNPFEGIRGDTNYELIGGLTHYGTYAQGLQKGLAKLGRQSTTYYGQPYEKFKASILQNLREGRPVIWWTTWRESYQTPQWVTLDNGTKIPLVPYEHTVVIVSANDKGVTYHDPYDGTVRFTTWANHQRTSSYFNNMALVVY